MSRTLLLHAWNIESRGGKYYLPYSHWLYLNEIVNYYDNVVLLSGCRLVDQGSPVTGVTIDVFNSVSVYELPLSSTGYIGALRYFFLYIKAYRRLNFVDVYYSRFPTPFGWLQKIFGKGKHRIIHYVGDPIDAARNNPNFSKIKKSFLIGGFQLENSLYTWGCRGAEVYTNGDHLAERLIHKGIQAKPLISSTLTESDFYFDDKEIRSESIRFIYLGYLRTAKGIEAIMEAFARYNKHYPKSSITIIGSGELEGKLVSFVERREIKNVRFLGHIDDRNQINTELRRADVFLFASLSEGSPRVVLEAMANGLLVLSTPVGSLPSIFKNDVHIIYADFNSPDAFYEQMLRISTDSNRYHQIRKASYDKVKKYTIKTFIKEIFS